MPIGDERSALIDTHAAPAGFEPASTPPGALKRFRHPASGIVFALVPGGELEMGFRATDQASLRRFFRGRWVDGLVAKLEEVAAPVRRVRVASFLMAIRPLATHEVRRVPGWEGGCDTFLREDGLRFASEIGMRLPSEAELEWVAREGERGLAFIYDGMEVTTRGREYPTDGRWGIAQLTAGEWAADEWHPSYHGAPSDGRAWRDGEDRGVTRGFLPFGVDQDPREAARGLACYRAKGVKLGEGGDRVRLMARLACDLPAST